MGDRVFFERVTVGLVGAGAATDQGGGPLFLREKTEGYKYLQMDADVGENKPETRLFRGQDDRYIWWLTGSDAPHDTHTTNHRTVLDRLQRGSRSTIGTI